LTAMSEPSAPALSDFFAKKAKKKIKGSNLNKDTTASKTEAKKSKTKDNAEEDGWEEETVVAATMKVEVAGKLTREEEKKEDEDNAAPAWGTVKNKKDNNDINEKKYPSLNTAVKSSNINLDDNSEPKINIATNENVYAALQNQSDDEEETAKGPKVIKPAMVQKKKGVRESVAIQQEVDKYSSAKKKDGKKDDDEDGDDAIDEDAETADVSTSAAAGKDKKKKKKDDKKGDSRIKEEDEEPEEPSVETAEDLQITPDLAAAKAKYEGRKKYAPEPIPPEDLEEEKENKPVQGKKKKVFVEDFEDDKKKRLVILDD